MSDIKDIRVFRFCFEPIYSIVLEKSPIPIFNDEQKLLGFAHVSPEDSCVINCVIDPASPERLELELKLKPYFVTPFEALERDGGEPQKGITYLVLGTKANLVWSVPFTKGEMS
jgi:hypothetical protein